MTETTQTLPAETGGTDITRFNALRHGGGAVALRGAATRAYRRIPGGRRSASWPSMLRQGLTQGLMFFGSLQTGSLRSPSNQAVRRRSNCLLAATAIGLPTQASIKVGS